VRLGDGIKSKEMIPMYAQPSQAKPSQPNQTKPVLLPVTLFCAGFQPVMKRYMPLTKEIFEQDATGDRDERDIRV